MNNLELIPNVETRGCGVNYGNIYVCVESIMEKDNVVFPQNLYTYLGAEAKQRILFLYSRQDLKPITTNIQGVFSLRNCIRMQNHKTTSERRGKKYKKHSIELRNTWKFHLFCVLHFVWSRVPHLRKSSLSPPWNNWLSEVLGVLEWARPWDDKKYKEPILGSNAT